MRIRKKYIYIYILYAYIYIYNYIHICTVHLCILDTVHYSIRQYFAVYPVPALPFMIGRMTIPHDHPMDFDQDEVGDGD